MPRNKRLVIWLSLFLFLTLSLTSCYHQKHKTHDALVQFNERQRDSLSFFTTHHYTKNYNFVVKCDSLVLLKQQPEEMVNNLQIDSFVVRRHDHLVVADIRMIPTDSIDSVWVQVARDQSTFGWIHESELIPNVVPDDPISQFISTFSDTHTIIFLVVICLISVGYLLRKLQRQQAPIVHFRDIDSFYPTLLTIIVASSATFYASIQTFAPEVWRHFYYHPTLNPFSVPPLLAIFLVSVWAMLIIGIAAIDDTRHQLPFGEAIMYLSGLAAVCAVDYIVFSITTLYYIGYLILVAYVIFALKRYFSITRAYYICGNCGAKLHRKGRCPHCGTMNK
jgi:hypothetical protein